MSGKLYQVQNGQKVDVTPTLVTMVPDATTSEKGVVQLSSATGSQSETTAATSKAVADVNAAVNTGLSNKANRALDNVTNAGWVEAKNKVIPGAGPGAIKVNYTLPASGGSVKATWTGYIHLNKNAGGDAKYIILRNTSRGLAAMVESSFSGGPSLRCEVPVTAGDTVVVEYSATGTTNVFHNISLIGLTTSTPV